MLDPVPDQTEPSTLPEFAPPWQPPAPGRSAPARSRRRRAAIAAVAALLLLVAAAITWLAVTAPPSRTARPIAPPSVTLLAADGHAIARRGAESDAPVDVRTLPPFVSNAFVAIEDRRFRHHFGIDPKGIARAAWHDVGSGRMREGGSTITQQLAKLVYLDSDRTAGRKLKEMMIALWLERRLSKDQILSRYLSDVYFGDNVYGLRAAARHYFGKRPEALSLGEAALLAGLMKAPSRLAPSTHLADAQARAGLVLQAMVEAGFATPAQAAAASPARLRLRPLPPPPEATYFADWVLPAAQAMRRESYRPAAVRTTLDRRLQHLAEAAVATAALHGAQAALVAMRPDGRVVAMVGGRSYAQSPFNRATQARRQPGSTFKLFVYLAALRDGLTPDDEVDDAPVTIGDWSPRNSDSHYLGPIPLREAFARSSNVAAVRLTQQVGPDAVAQAAHDLGIASPLRADPGIALGTSGVSPLELAAAFAAVAGGAGPVRPYGLPGAGQAPPAPLDADQQRMLLDLLAATVNEGTGRGAALTTQVYGKTGTSQDNRDAWFVGFAGGLVTAVWVGRDDNQPLPGVAGGGLPAHIWRSFMAPAIHARPAARSMPEAVDPDAGVDHFLGGVFHRVGDAFRHIRIGHALGHLFGGRDHR